MATEAETDDPVEPSADQAEEEGEGVLSDMGAAKKRAALGTMPEQTPQAEPRPVLPYRDALIRCRIQRDAFHGLVAAANRARKGVEQAEHDLLRSAQVTSRRDRLQIEADVQAEIEAERQRVTVDVAS